MSNLEITRAQRLDQYVIEQYSERSRSFATQLINEGHVSVNNKVASKGGYKIRTGDQITIDYTPQKLPLIATIDLEILYEDQDCIVINKPVGLLAHSTSEYNLEPTVESWLRSRTAMTGKRAGIVHRLDRLTSGVMICAKTPEALSWLQKQFSKRQVKKTYIAIVEGHLRQPEALIDMPIGRNPRAPHTFRVDINGKPAQTQYLVIQEGPQYSMLQLKPITGRTHQLRVHLKHVGHSIVGDPLYGKGEAERLYLHALELEITLPNRERLVIKSSLPKSYKKAIDKTDV